LRSKWAAGKAVRAGLAFGGRIQPHFFAPEDRQNKREIKKLGLDARRYCQSGSDRLEKQPTDLRRKSCYFGDRTLKPWCGGENVMRLDFRISGDWSDELSDLGTAEETDLRYYVAPGDVVLSIDQTDLSANWGWIPLIDFALALREITEALSESEGSETFEFTESEATLQFDRIGDEIVITSSYAPGELRAPFSIFQNQVDAFARRLNKELLQKHPELELNPDYQRLKLG
jgi:hypothetical protein